MILCTTDSLVNREFDLADMGDRFVRWMNNGYWTARGEPFDIGIATSTALLRVADETPAQQAGGRDEFDNGNGSLMRILPVVLRFAAEPIELFADRVESVSSVTHGHSRSRMACVFYGLVVRKLLLGLQPHAALDSARAEFSSFYRQAEALPHFRHILEDDLASLPEGEIVSTGYVLHTCAPVCRVPETTQEPFLGIVSKPSISAGTRTPLVVSPAVCGSSLRDEVHSN